MRVLLIQPGYRRSLGLRCISLIEPLGLEAVAAHLGDHEVRILDLRLEEDLENTVSSFRPQVCGINCSFTVDVYQTIAIAEFLKKNGESPLVFVGGHHASLNPQDFHRGAIDGVVIGEGESTFPELMATLDKGEDLIRVPGLALNRPAGQVITPPRLLIKDLDSLFPPARHLTDRYRDQYYLWFQKPIAALETARGCPYRCNFCSIWKFYRGSCRTKSPQKVVEELAGLPEENVLITDDNFLLSPSRAQEIARLIQEQSLKKRFTIQARSDTIARHPEVVALWREVGLQGVFIGFEKIQDPELQGLNKHSCAADNEQALQILREQGIEMMPSFIVDPDWDRADFERLRHYILQRRIYIPSLTILTPLPGTEFFDLVHERLVTRDYELFDLMHAVLPTRLNLPEFYRRFAGLYQAGYLLSLVRRGLKAVRSPWSSLLPLLKLLNSAKVMFSAGYYLADHQRIS